MTTLPLLAGNEVMAEYEEEQKEDVTQEEAYSVKEVVVLEYKICVKVAQTWHQQQEHQKQENWLIEVEVS